MPIRFDQFELDETNAQLTRDGRAIQLPPKALAVLCALARQPGKLTRKDELLDEVWGHRHVSESVLKSTISQVRAALGDDAAKPRYVETASRLGYRFIGRPASEMPVIPPPAPVPPPLRSGELSGIRAQVAPMVGRHMALDRLRAAWGRARAGHHQLFWIAGDAGVGKTTLVDSLMREVGAVALAHGQCVEHYGAGEPYLPVLQGLGALVRNFPELPPLMRAIAPTWFVQMPWLSTEAERIILSRDLAGINHERMVRELRELIERFTVNRPLLFITEDLHWSDHATLNLMNHFARRRGEVGVLWIGTFRLTQVVAEGHPLQALRHELKLHRLCEEVLLDPFSEREVAEYLEQRLPQAPIPEAAVRRLHRHTDGLPLFITNIVESMLGGDKLGSDPWQDWMRAELPVPEDLAGTLEKQILRLPEQTRALLEGASACGVEFQAMTVADALGIDAADVSRLCDELVRKQFWLRHEDVVDLPDGRLDTRYAFRHAIYRHVFYDRMGYAQRVQLHRRIAQSLLKARASGLKVTPAELASHHEAGRETPAALRSYAQAAEMALSQFAPREAVDLTARALSLLPQCPEGPERLELELALVARRGMACSQVFGIASGEAAVAIDRAREICDLLPQTPERALLVTGLGWLIYARGEYESALELGRRVHQMAVAHENPVLVVSACNLMGITCGTRGELLEASEWFERGIATRDALGDRLPLAPFLMDPGVTMRGVYGIILACRGLAEQARAHVAIAMERASSVGQPMARSISLRGAATVEMRLGNPERVLQYTAEMQKIIEAHALTPPVGPSLWLSGWAKAKLGEGRAGVDLIRSGHQQHLNFGMITGSVEAQMLGARAAVMMQDWSGAQAWLDGGLRECERLGEGLFLPDFRMVQGHIHAANGKLTLAREAFREGVEIARAQGALLSENELLAELERLDAGNCGAGR